MVTAMVKTLTASQYRGKKGFTLIELLIVVGIIGILAAIAIPSFKKHQVKTFNTAAQSDLRNLRTDLEAYFADNYKYPY